MPSDRKQAQNEPRRHSGRHNRLHHPRPYSVIRPRSYSAVERDEVADRTESSGNTPEQQRPSTSSVGVVVQDRPHVSVGENPPGTSQADGSASPLQTPETSDVVVADDAITSSKPGTSEPINARRPIEWRGDDYFPSLCHGRACLQNVLSRTRSGQQSYNQYPVTTCGLRQPAVQIVGNPSTSTSMIPRAMFLQPSASGQSIRLTIFQGSPAQDLSADVTSVFSLGEDQARQRPLGQLGLVNFDIMLSAEFPPPAAMPETNSTDNNDEIAETRRQRSSRRRRQ